jgi:hypothetical protein
VKNVIALFFILISQVLTAQNYQCFNSNRSYYYLSLDSWQNRVESILFDSIAVYGTDTVFFNYAQLPNSDGEFDLCVNDTTWVGNKIVINSIWTILFNSSGDSIKIKSNGNIGEYWKLYQYDNGNYINATVDTIQEETVLGILTNTKVISLLAMDSTGNSISNIFNGKKFKLSETIGLTQLYRINDFPNDTSTVKLIGETNPNLGFQEFNAKEIFTYEIGDEFHYKFVSTDIDGGCVEYTSLDVIGKSTSINLDTITYTYHRKLFETYYSYWANGDTTITTLINDTILQKIVFSSYSYLDQPQLIAQFIFPYCYKSVRIVPGYVMPFEKELRGYYEYDSISHCFDPIIDCGPALEYYAPGLGLTYLDICCMSSMCVTYREQVYAKKSDNEYGTPLDWYELILSTNYILPNVNSKIFPNPFSDKIEIQLPSNADYFIQLLNSIGQIIYSEKLNGSRTSINTEQLPSGAYFLRINSDQTMETVQLIK